MYMYMYMYTNWSLKERRRQTWIVHISGRHVKDGSELGRSI
jgi:hypothetical protein